MARLDPQTNRVVATIPAGRTAVVFGVGSLWVGGPWPTDERSLLRIDPRTDRVVAQSPLGERPFDFTYHGGDLWITTRAGVVIRFAPAP